mmetsp:Transcript_3008/g.6985  ORF Transcript_3008/g.6985 Transcript_3008/m.6985 type:complete len:225 (-) Transcript_3008:1265-1939(-)
MATSSMRISRFQRTDSKRLRRSKIFPRVCGSSRLWYTENARHSVSWSGYWPLHASQREKRSLPPWTCFRRPRKFLRSSYMCGRWTGIKFKPRPPLFVWSLKPIWHIFPRSSLLTLPTSHITRYISSGFPDAKNAKYPSQMAISSGAEFVWSFWCHCSRNLHSIPGRCPSLMPWLRMMFRMPCLMPSPPEPLPRGMALTQRRRSVLTRGSSAAPTAVARTPPIRS